jgi:hypothetical protein
MIVIQPPLTSTEEELRYVAASLHAAIVERFGG